MNSQSKKYYPRAAAERVAGILCKALGPCCERIAVAGSVRRGKLQVGDVEILFIPKVLRDQPDPGDFFKLRSVNLADEMIAELERQQVLERRLNTKGTESYGPLNKLMVHVDTGMPVDLFAANSVNWWNYLVCRTGPAASNSLIAYKAKMKGWKWSPYQEGFTRGSERHAVASEEDVFAFVGLPFLEPGERV